MSLLAWVIIDLPKDIKLSMEQQLTFTPIMWLGCNSRNNLQNITYISLSSFAESH